MGVGKDFTDTMKAIVVTEHTKLHKAHQSCPICSAGPFRTIERMMDHVEGHSERVQSRIHKKDDKYIVLCAPSDYYREHPKEFPESLEHLTSLDEQERQLGIEYAAGYDSLEYTGLPSIRRKMN